MADRDYSAGDQAHDQAAGEHRDPGDRIESECERGCPRQLVRVSKVGCPDCSGDASYGQTYTGSE
jgi:hypothetical protein